MKDEKTAVSHAVLRMNARAWGVSTGLLFGSILFIATLVLVIRGGPNVGPHLGLLSIYLPGYRVTFLGSFIGFVYMFVLGYGFGRLVGILYNRVAGFPR
jgi:hypothetical protein